MKTVKRVFPLRELRDKMLELIECPEFNEPTNDHAAKIRIINLKIRESVAHLQMYGKNPKSGVKLICLNGFKLIYNLWYLKTVLLTSGPNSELVEAAYNSTKKEVEQLIALYEKEMSWIA